MHERLTVIATITGIMAFLILLFTPLNIGALIGWGLSMVAIGLGGWGAIMVPQQRVRAIGAVIIGTSVVGLIIFLLS